MNNKGWGLQEMLVLSGILIIAIVIVAVLVNQTFGDGLGIPKPNDTVISPDDNKSYNDMEISIKEAADKYITDTYKNNLEFDKVVVTIKTLEHTKYLKPLYDYKNKNRKCSGYVVVNKKDMGITFSPYVSCGLKYKTNGYDVSFDA